MHSNLRANLGKTTLWEKGKGNLWRPQDREKEARGKDLGSERPKKTTSFLSVSPIDKAKLSSYSPYKTPKAKNCNILFLKFQQSNFDCYNLTKHESRV